MSEHLGQPDSEVETGPGTGLKRAVVAFVGHSGSGKTTLLLKLIPMLRTAGLRVALIKHSSHRGIETDVPGSDSRRFWDAGADEVVLVTPDRTTHARRVTREPALGDVLATVGNVDLVVLEGFKRSDVPKIEVVRMACKPALLEGLTERVACVTDVDDLSLACPVFGLEDVEGLVSFLVGYATGVA